MIATRRHAPLWQSPEKRPVKWRYVRSCRSPATQAVVGHSLAGARSFAFVERLPVSDAAEEIAPRAHARIVYLGPVSPHWEIVSDFGDRKVMEEFRARALARLVLLPRDDPQFRRNRERIVRDAERERILLEWDLGLPEGEDI